MLAIVNHQIGVTLGRDSIELLKALQGDRALIMEAGNYDDLVPKVRLRAVDRTAYIGNVPTVASDGDEYPRLVVSEHLGWHYTWTCLSVMEERLDRVTVLRDEVAWHRQRQGWKVIADIGLRLSLSGREIVILTIDSGAGFLMCRDVNDPSLLDNLSVERVWQFKADQLDNAIRREIDIETL
jgi:hypothetical protein